MERDIKSLATVVNIDKKGEVNKLLTLFSPSDGIIYATAYGARKSSKAIQVPLYAEGVFSLYYKREKDSYSLKDADIVNDRENISKSIGKTLASSLFSELIISSKSADEQSYALYSKSLDYLNLTENAERTVIAFIIHFLSISGLLPSFTFCPVCQRQYTEEETLGFNDRYQTLSCLSCDSRRETFILPMNARKFIKRISEISFEDAFLLSVSSSQEKKVLNWLVRLLKEIYPIHIRSLDFNLEDYL